MKINIKRIGSVIGNWIELAHDWIQYLVGQRFWTFAF